MAATQFAAVMTTGIPECDIGEKQTRLLAQSLADVSRHYPPLQISEKHQDWFMLVYVTGQIGMTQIALFKMRMAAEEQARKTRENSNVVDGVFTRTQ